MSTASNQSSESFRPPSLSLAFCGFWSFVTYQLFYYGERGVELATIGSILTGVVAIGQFAKAWSDWGKLRDVRRHRRNYQKTGAKHGTSRFATAEDVAGSDIFSDHKGIFLGTMPVGRRKTRDVFYDGDATISIIAPPGESKSTGIAAPSMCAGIGQNLIGNDVSGELFSIGKPALEAQGYEVVAMTPFPSEVSNLIGAPVTDVGLDVFSAFDPSMRPESIRSELLKTMTWVMPGKPDMDEKSDYFFRLGRMIGGWLGLREIVHGRKPTLPQIRSQVMTGTEAISELYTEAFESTAFGGVYAEMARSLEGLRQTAGPQYAGGHGVAEICLDPFDAFSDMGRHTSKSTFDPRSLKDPTKKIALFLIYTLGNFESYAAPMSMSLTYLFDTIASDKQSGRVTALVDEVGSLNMPKLASSLLFYRKMGLRCVLFWQDQSGQAEKKYGKAAMREILSASKLKIGMGIQEPETLEMFSKLAGTEAISNISINNRSILTDPTPDHSSSYSQGSVPLLRPEDIRMMEEVLVIGGRIPPLKLNKVRYWERAHWRKMTGPSPYYRG